MTEREDLRDIIRLSKNSNKETWGLLTGNGFNLACQVDTGYNTLCNELINSFIEELGDKKPEFSEDLKRVNFNFEQFLQENESKENANYRDRIAIKTIRERWKIILVRACEQDLNQYNNSCKLNDFLKLFDYWITLNVDPFFYRKCLSADGYQTNKNKVEYSLNPSNVYIGKDKENVKACNIDYLSKKGKEEFCSITNIDKAEIKNNHKYIDGFSKKESTKKGNLIKNYSFEDHNLFYLHGALHIRREKSGFKKICATNNRLLIQEIERQSSDTDTTIFEALSENKNNRINENDYLKEQFEAFQKIHCQNLVIYGASLNENDAHIWNAINQNETIEKIYIGYYNLSDQNDVTNKIKSVLSFLKKKEIQFFQSSDLLSEAEGMVLNNYLNDKIRDSLSAVYTFSQDMIIEYIEKNKNQFFNIK